MASPRFPSPLSRDPTPELLTPRSKIKALLATVESSDEDDINQTTVPKIASSGDKPAQQDDSDSDIPTRPRGKLASRLQAAAENASDLHTPAAPTETARDRVRKMLQLEQEGVENSPDEEMAEAEDEEPQLPIATRRLKRRVARETSPEDTELQARSQSPGLFVSSPMRPSPSKSTHDHSESDNDLPSLKSNRFQALVERKKQERLAREAAEEARKAEQRAQQEKIMSELDQLDDDDMSGITDDEGGRKLTQEVRPTRKASKKAIEEMNRETQRMARSMQLAHEAKTRKKLSKAALFERFNFKTTDVAPLEAPTQRSSRPATPQTDAEGEDKDKDTPPSSPPLDEKENGAENAVSNDVIMDDVADELPTLDAVLSSPPRVDKGKGLAFEVDEPEKPEARPVRRVRVRLPLPTKVANVASDDELEITTTTADKINAVFNSIPLRRTTESHSLQALKALAQVKSPGKETRRKGQREGLTPGEFHTFLMQKAKEQARVARDQRLEMLRAQGIVVQTAEERERQNQEVEDILAKAREEAQMLMQEERAAAKKKGEENGEADPLDWDDSEDEEYEDGANDADVEGSAVELSGSEEEDDEEEEESEEGVVAGSALVDGEAAEGESEADGEVSERGNGDLEIEDGDDDNVPLAKRKRARNRTAVLSDDEAEVSVEATPRPKTTPHAASFKSPAAPNSVLRSAKKTFIPGLPVQGPAGLGLTQIFAGTMDDSQKSQPNGLTQSMMPDFDNFPDSNFSAAMEDKVDDMVLDSQREETQGTTQGVQLNLAQTQMHGLDSLLREELQSQISDMMEASQDVGFQSKTPLKDRFVEPPFSTADTVPADVNGDGLHDSPLVRRGRLRRKAVMSSIEEETIPLSVDQEKTTQASKTAFNALAAGARLEKKRKQDEEFNKKSNAKEMVEEQAEESEDEYAGLGGADGEDSDDEFDATVQDLIDDAAGNDADERKLAAFNADLERQNDEKAVEKLYKDITSGMLRRKRGADYDLSDSDDGGEARRRMKRRQFAKMQKALFADERVKKIAENPGNQAFLRTIEDRGSDDEVDFLEIMDVPASQGEESQSQDEIAAGQQRLQTIPDSQPRNPLGSAGENRAPAHARRTKDGKKPSNIGEVRETLSDLLEDRHSSVIPATEAGSDSEDEENGTRGDKENQSPNSRRTRNAIVDRISLKRTSSSLSNSNRLAFTATGAASSSFKVPALLRRATTNSSLVSSSTTASTSSSTTMGGSSGFGEEAKIKKGAGKRSGVHGFARDSDRHARMQENERRRQEKKVRGAESRVGLVGGLLGKGSFE